MIDGSCESRLASYKHDRLHAALERLQVTCSQTDQREYLRSRGRVRIIPRIACCCRDGAIYAKLRWTTCGRAMRGVITCLHGNLATR
jgi:hypothetical protein